MSARFPKAENRQHERKAVEFDVRVRIGDHEVPGRIVDISAGGARLELDEPIRENPNIVLTLGRLGDYEGKVVWAYDLTVGLKFTEDPMVMADVIGALAMYGAA